jgi:hypothetical protein
VPRAKKGEGAYEGKKLIERGRAYKGKKMRKKGPIKVKMKQIDPKKYFCSANIKKVPRAYESLNPAMIS